MDDGCTAVSACAGYGSTAADATTFTRYIAALQTAGFLAAAAAAVRAMLRVQALLHDPSYCRTLDGDPFDVRSYMVQQDVLCAITAVGASKVLMTVSQLLVRDTNVKLMGPAFRAEQARSSSSSSSTRTLTVPGDLARDVEALADSGLLAAVAEALVDGPDVHSASYGNAIGSGGGGGGGGSGLRGTRNRVTCDMHRVSTTMGAVLFNVVMIRVRMGGPQDGLGSGMCIAWKRRARCGSFTWWLGVLLVVVVLRGKRTVTFGRAGAQAPRATASLRR